MFVELEEAPVVERPTVDWPTISDDEERRREVLLRAAELIEERGWIAGSAGMHDNNGPFCLLGAIGFAAYGKGDMGYIYGHKFLRISDPEAAWGWNDRLDINRPRRHLFQRRPKPGEIVTATLRQMAHGAAWEEATRCSR